MAFERMEQARRRAQDFERTLDDLCEALARWPDEAAAARRLRDGYLARMREFFSLGHKFSLAVVGQVKAGKSTFLNTLLFGGQDVLPHAAGPKTSVLTRLEYAEETTLRVEYYTAADWAALEAAAAVPLDTPAAHGAREILHAAEGMLARRDECAAKGEETFACPDDETLAAILEDTVGGGMLSPFVKCVTLGLCREELRGLSVVDTPGLNDPLPSRSQRTEEFLETCDAAFFLSHAGYFLDDAGVAILTGQLARKGVRRIRLVASRFDGALADAAASGEKDAGHVRAQLAQRAQQKLDEVLTRMRRTGMGAPVVDALLECRRPLFVSALARRMALTTPAQYTPAQHAVARSLFAGRAPEAAELEELSGFSDVEELFRLFIDEKDATLAQKADAFAAVAQTELRTMLTELCARRAQQLNAFAAEEEDAARRCVQAAAEARRIEDASARMFDEHLAPVAELLHSAAEALSAASEEASVPAERRDVTLHTQYVTVSDSKLWKPWTWGRTHREYTVREAVKPYWDVTDTVEYLSAFQRDMKLLWDDLYAPLTDTAALQNRLVLFARETLRAGGGGDSGGAALALTRKALGHIAAPRFVFSTEALRAKLAAQYPGRVESPDQRAALMEACYAAVREASVAAVKELEQGAKRFERMVRAAQQDYSAALLRPVNDARRAVEERRAAARAAAAACQEFVETASRLI